MAETLATHSSLPEPTFIFHPLSAPLVKTDVSPSPSLGYRPGNKDFMFVEFQLGSREKAFIVRNFHQRRKQASIDRLNVRPLLRTRISSQDEQAAAGYANARNRRLIQTSCERRSLSTYPSHSRYGDPFSPYVKPIAARLNMYLHHCTSTSHQSCFDAIRKKGRLMFKYPESRRPRYFRLIPFPRPRDATLVDATRSRVIGHAADMCVQGSRAQGDPAIQPGGLGPGR
jgi:hypothetical protein